MTSNHHQPRRPVLAFVLLAAAVFLALGDQGGVLGQHLARSADHYIGQLGLLLVVVSLICASYSLGAPAGTATKIARALRDRRRVSVVEPVQTLSPNDRRKADDVRSAMKNLGYLKHEYDPVVAGLDLSMPLDGLVRASLKKLREQKVLS